jgi:hypothetical protein
VLRCSFATNSFINYHKKKTQGEQVLPILQFLENLASTMNTSVQMLQNNYIATFGEYNLEMKRDFESWIQTEKGKMEEEELEEEEEERNNIEVTESDSHSLSSSSSSSFPPLFFSSSSSSSPTPPTIYKWSGSHIHYSSEDEDADDEEHE